MEIKNMKTISIGEKKVGAGQPTYIIAEAGINHDGDIENFKKMIRSAKEAGVDAIKFQTFTADNMQTRSASLAGHLEAGIGKEDGYAFAIRMTLSPEGHQELFDLCEEVGLPFLSTAGAPEGVDLLEKLGVSAYKVASMDLDNLPLLDYMARKGKPIILSTGMGNLGEIEKALEVIHAAGNDQVIVLHCTSQYPPKEEDVNLKAMDTLQAAFQVQVGYSDHTKGIIVPLAAVARGACVIEKHFTLDKSMPGPDHPVSGEPDDFRQIVEGSRLIKKALGSPIKKPVSAEVEMTQVFRRSIVTSQEISEGTVLTKDMLVFKRPGSGISPADVRWIIGRKTSVQIGADEVLSMDQLV
jgi:N,N'-diacetyllegionaminate synthase